jgi:hypothetical protein
MLLAILAPGSIEAEVGRIQQEIFRSRGFVSAIALEPLVPVAFLDAGAQLPRGLLDSLDRCVRAPLRISVASRSTVRWRGGALFLGLDTGGAWSGLRRECARLLRGQQAGAALFPVAEGFFLGCMEAAGDRSLAAEVRGLVAGKDGGAAVHGFSSATLALLSIAPGLRGARWWRDVTCEVAGEKPLRGTRA